ncbi:MAG: 50S ribosomal protein L15 [Candidatus Cloacimonetes bacterium]|nr:50S ribosomal protein L15 [Candidatus Cloacimonadota bacterium]
MKLNELKIPVNSKHKRKRLGKGNGSGYGKTAGRGMNGQKCRSGASIPNWFEGGQMPIHRRLPGKGFTNIFKKKNRIVSLNKLARVEENVIDIPLMEKLGLIENPKYKKFPVKVLANRENKFDRKKIIKANKFSEKAVELIEKIGGKAEVV